MADREDKKHLILLYAHIHVVRISSTKAQSSNLPTAERRQQVLLTFDLDMNYYGTRMKDTWLTVCSAAATYSMSAVYRMPVSSAREPVHSEATIGDGARSEE